MSKPKLDLIDCAAMRMPWHDWKFRLANKVAYRDYLRKQLDMRNAHASSAQAETGKEG